MTCRRVDNATCGTLFLGAVPDGAALFLSHKFVGCKPVVGVVV